MPCQDESITQRFRPAFGAVTCRSVPHVVTIMCTVTVRAIAEAITPKLPFLLLPTILASLILWPTGLGIFGFVVWDMSHFLLVARLPPNTMMETLWTARWGASGFVGIALRCIGAFTECHRDDVGLCGCLGAS